ncbi:SWIM zinc finger family protein [Pseudochryseolinea flava]|uniref:SWIM zinc finger family protein n=1 Tax=Pseudochryseolinea flava TaxID=2059302 RepID=A0A364Y2F7_9BACT|nr:SWIM zinc finger family protein [Pseudochryseolinea flava]RAW00492.1 SWIM zinc finger family protein [Pseudochryseolinea flava]
MQFDYKFKGDTSVSNSAHGTAMNFAPDVYREPTYFSGYLNKHIPFREAISALHDIVVSDFRFKPKDKSDYKAWAKQQEDIWLAEYMRGAADVGEKIKGVQERLSTIRKQKDQIMEPFHKAKRKYFDFLYQTNRDAWVVLDPVITIHPDELFFECFSQDESSYGKLGCNYNVFNKVSEFKCGTTNVDYSSLLYNEFQKIRDYKETYFNVDPSGFEVQTTAEESYKEVKIDVPASWVRGFLQVSSAMTIPATTFHLHPMDVYNICFMLRRYKEKEGPRSIRWILKPGQPVKLVLEPWNYEIVCGRSLYEGTSENEIRIWGRRRLLLLERLIPVTQSFKVVLLGSGLPSFYIADLGDLNFTLGLSGWTVNDWSRVGNFDLLAPRAEVDSMTMQKVYVGLREEWVEDTDSLAKRLGLEKNVVLGALSAFTQAGRVIYDLNRNAYRIRELAREALPLEELRFANAREESANRFVLLNHVTLAIGTKDGNTILKGNVRDKDKVLEAELVIDKDERALSGKCNCNFFKQNKLMQGPCEHMIALRIAMREKTQK